MAEAEEVLDECDRDEMADRNRVGLVIPGTIWDPHVKVKLRGFAKFKKFQKSKNNLEVGPIWI